MNKILWSIVIEFSYSKAQMSTWNNIFSSFAAGKSRGFWCQFYKNEGFESILYLNLYLFMSSKLVFPSMKDTSSLSGTSINSTFDPLFFSYPNISLNNTERDLRRSAPLKKTKKQF